MRLSLADGFKAAAVGWANITVALDIVDKCKKLLLLSSEMLVKMTSPPSFYY